MDGTVFSIPEPRLDQQLGVAQMIQASARIVEQERQVAFRRHEFDLLVPPKRARVTIRRCHAADLAAVSTLATTGIGGELAHNRSVENVLQVNPNSVFLFKRRDLLVGVWAMLMLSPRGIEALLLGELDTRNPEPEMLVSATQEPSAIYVWAVVASSLASEGIRHVSAFLRQPLYVRSNLYAKPATSAGKQILSDTGFRSINQVGEGLHRYLRHANRQEILDA